MYVTRRLSDLRRSPELFAVSPEGPNSGYLVIQDEESETYSCFGLCKNRNLYDLPFPQNKELTVRYETNTGQTTQVHRTTQVHLDAVLLIPVLNQGLSSNRYYAIVPHGNHIGEAFTCSKEEDKTTCCFCRCIKDVKSRPLDPRNSYQQIEIVPYEGLCSGGGTFYAESTADDGFPPYFFRRKGWSIYTKSAENCALETAQGIDSKLRNRLPEFDFPLSQRSSSSPFVVGKWYCPFMFVKEGTLRDQVKKSLYYMMTLEQRWEQIFTCQRANKENSVVIDAIIDKEEAFVEGSKADKLAGDGVIWFNAMEGEKRVGLRVEIVERMKWEQQKWGWKNGEDKQVRVTKVQELKESVEWSGFGCYILIERFCLRRRDGSLVVCIDFKHLDKMKTIWE